jgi:hypothetical protein
MDQIFAGSRLLSRLGLALGLAGLCASPARAQDRDLDPAFGSATLKAGFIPDPFVKNLSAGGPIQTKLGGVEAHVAKAPSFKLHYTAGSYPLTIHVESEAETTLLINLPDGAWVANRQKKGGPGLRFEKPQSGRYDIWVGAVGKDNAPAVLKITELEVPHLKDGSIIGAGGKGGPPEVVRQGFPAGKADEKDLTKSDTAWEIEWDITPVGEKDVFRIVSARFLWQDSRKNPRELIVARNIQLVEAFTQYDDGKTSFLDIAKVGLHPVPGNPDFLGPTCVGEGKLLESKTPAFNKKVYKELHYDGLRWVSIYGDDPPARKLDYRAHRGEKLVLWSAIASGNYVYLMEYNFTDDGRIVCRLGFTAHNYFDRAKLAKRRTPYGFRLKDADVHVHAGCWRLDFDLSDPGKKQGGPEANELKLVRRVLEEGKFQLEVSPFPGDEKAKDGNEAREGKAKWIAKHFTTLRAESLAVKNTRGLPIAYDLISTRMGSTEDLLPIGDSRGLDGVKMDFIGYDFWVTRTPKEAKASRDYKHYYLLPEIAAAERPLAGQRSTVWHSVPALHVPRDEDFGAGGLDAENGVALTEWVGFTLRPRNLFDGTPLYRTKD